MFHTFFYFEKRVQFVFRCRYVFCCILLFYAKCHLQQFKTKKVCTKKKQKPTQRKQKPRVTLLSDFSKCAFWNRYLLYVRTNTHTHTPAVIHSLVHTPSLLSFSPRLTVLRIQLHLKKKKKICKNLARTYCWCVMYDRCECPIDGIQK